MKKMKKEKKLNVQMQLKDEEVDEFFGLFNKTGLRSQSEFMRLIYAQYLKELNERL